jgi:hypothetical protein
MLGFLIGAVCLVGLIKTIRGGRRYGWGGGGWGGPRFGGCGYGGGRCGHGHHGGYGYRGGYDDDAPFGGRGGPRIFLRMLFERLDTTPGQEKVIKSALEDLWQAKGELREELKQMRNDVARAVRGEVLDEAALNEAHSRQDAVIAKLRERVTQAMRTIHEALDERQRGQVADMLERGPFGGGRGPWGRGPYRTANA